MAITVTEDSSVCLFYQGKLRESYKLKSGTVLTSEQLKEIFSGGFQGDGHGVVLQGPEDAPWQQMAKGCWVGLTAAQQQNPRGVLDGMQFFISGGFVCLDWHPRPDASTTGAPKQDGLMDATNSAIYILNNRPITLQTTRLDTTDLFTRGTKCDVLFGMSKTFAQAQQYSINISASESRDLATDLRLVDNSIQRDLITDLDLAFHADNLQTYLGGPAQKGKQRKKKNKQLTAQVAQQTEQKVGAEARAKATTEVENNLNDAVHSYLDKKNNG